MTHPTLSGRLGTQLASKTVQLFAQAGTGGTNLGPFTSAVGAHWASDACYDNQGPGRAFLVTMLGRQVQRFGSAQAALARNVIINEDNTLSSGARSENLIFKARVRVKTEIGISSYLLDANQSFVVFGRHVDVGLVGPANTTIVPPGGTSQTYDNTVVDAVIGARIQPTEQTNGLNQAYLTQHVEVPAGAQTTVARPRGAQFLRIYFTGVGAGSATTWDRLFGDPSSTPTTLGFISFANDASRQNMQQCGNETHYRIGSTDGSNARSYQFIWRIAL